MLLLGEGARLLRAPLPEPPYPPAQHPPCDCVRRDGVKPQPSVCSSFLLSDCTIALGE